MIILLTVSELGFSPRLSCKYNNSNQLLILETLLIKRKMPELNCGLKASKQLSLFL